MTDGTTPSERFDRVDQTLDRILGILQDHGERLGTVENRLTRIDSVLDELQKDFREHLLWHLGRAS